MLFAIPSTSNFIPVDFGVWKAVNLHFSAARLFVLDFLINLAEVVMEKKNLILNNDELPTLQSGIKCQSCLFFPYSSSSQYLFILFISGMTRRSVPKDEVGFLHSPEKRGRGFRDPISVGESFQTAWAVLLTSLQKVYAKVQESGKCSGQCKVHDRRE